mgnify:CR=1 FL=1
MGERQAEEQYVRVWGYDELGVPMEGEGGQSGKSLGRRAPCSSQHDSHDQRGKSGVVCPQGTRIQVQVAHPLRTCHELLGAQRPEGEVMAPSPGAAECLSLGLALCLIPPACSLRKNRQGLLLGHHCTPAARNVPTTQQG